MAPANAIRRHPLVEKRTAALAAYAEKSPLNRMEMAEGRQLGAGHHHLRHRYQYVKEVFGDSVSVLKLGMVNPLPEG